jgi:hypothetical protein
MTPRGVSIGCLVVLGSLTGPPQSALANPPAPDGTSPAPPQRGPGDGTSPALPERGPGEEPLDLPAESKIPPPVGNPFIQYGVAFTTEFVATPGRMCSGLSASQPCILGSGGGVVFPRIGWRSAGAWYAGLAVEFTKQDAFTLYKLPILQQYRLEGRYYFLIGQVLTPYVGASGGLAAYGDTWTVQTFGPDASLSFGVEAQVARGTVVALVFDYRTIYFKSFVDTANTTRESSVAQFLGLDLQLEVRDPW